MKAIFLSAGVPVEGRAGFETADPYLIREAVSAFVEVVLGRRLIVWGGQPGITPMIWAAAESMGIDYGACVRLFQSQYFEDRYPEDNERFRNVRYVPAVTGSLPGSLRRMRVEMLSHTEFEAAVFIGGMEGVRDEYRMFVDLCPDAAVIAMPTPGGVAAELFNEMELPEELASAFDYSRWLYKLLNIKPNERRLTGIS